MRKMKYTEENIIKKFKEYNKVPENYDAQVCMTLVTNYFLDRSKMSCDEEYFREIYLIWTTCQDYINSTWRAHLRKKNPLNIYEEIMARALGARNGNKNR